LSFIGKCFQVVNAVRRVRRATVNTGPVAPRPRVVRRAIVASSTAGPAAAVRVACVVVPLTALGGLAAAADGTGAVPDLAAVRGELRGLLGQMVSYVLGRRPRLLGYVEGR